eukprot:m.194623 g.194623  ORF g.194623 m.194623 type:complete len:103 (-) comp18654_c0_seq1:255-563(-)
MCTPLSGTSGECAHTLQYEVSESLSRFPSLNPCVCPPPTQSAFPNRVVKKAVARGMCHKALAKRMEVYLAEDVARWDQPVRDICSPFYTSSHYRNEHTIAVG